MTSKFFEQRMIPDDQLKNMLDAALNQPAEKRAKALSVVASILQKQSDFTQELQTNV